jgi:hypothetical protein
MKYYWFLFEILKICLSDVSHLDAIALVIRKQNRMTNKILLPN